MAELANREEFERRLTSRLEALYGQRKRAMLRTLGSPPNFDNLPPQWWEDVRREIEEEYLAMLILLIVAVGSIHGVDIGDRSNVLALRRASEDAGRITERKRQQYERHRIDWERRRSGQPPDKPPIPSDVELDREIDKIFGPKTAKNESETEVSRGQTDAANESRRRLENEGRVIVAYWRHSRVRPKGHAGASVDPCPICTPREGRPESEWGGREPGHAHPHCDCFPEFVEVVDGEERVIDEN